MEISWGVPGDSEDSVGLNSLCGWDLCKMQLKTESKDMATLRGHHWIYVRLMLKCVAPISFPSATQNKQKKFFMCLKNQWCSILIWGVYNGLSAPWIVQGDKAEAVLQNAENPFDVMATMVEDKFCLQILTDSSNS